MATNVQKVTQAIYGTTQYSTSATSTDSYNRTTAEAITKAGGDKIPSQLVAYPWIDNYIYIYHATNKDGTNGVVVFMPEFADSITDKTAVNFASTPVLARTAPIFSFSNAGPRTISVQFNLHRDMMTELNRGVSNAPDIGIGVDYVDVIIRELQSAALPKYNSTTKLVNPPLVALRLGDDIFIKGVIQGGVGVTYKYPIIADVNTDGDIYNSKHKYSNVDIAFDISEVDPYDADDVMLNGSYRGLSSTLERNIQTIYNNVTGRTMT